MASGLSSGLTITTTAPIFKMPNSAATKSGPSGRAMITRCSGATPAELEHVGIAVGQRLNLTVAQPSGIGQQRGPVSPAFAHPGIEKAVGDVELRGKFVRHGVRVRYLSS